MQVHLGALLELIASKIPDRAAFIWKEGTVTYGQLLERAHRMANGLRALGLGCKRERSELRPWESGHDHIALYMYNRPAYMEGMYGTFLARTASINVNYRYVDDELIYILENSSSRAIIYQACFAPRVAAIRGRLPLLQHFIQIADDSGEPLLAGAVDYEQWLAAQSSTALDLPYSPDDLYLLYTGGTTGMPKGVVWRHEDVFFNGLGGHTPGLPRIDSEEVLLQFVIPGFGGRPIVCAPFMHGAGQWTCFNTFHRGGTVVLPDETKRFDSHNIWQTIEKHKVDALGLIGDSFALPLLSALREQHYDTSSIRILVSTAAVLSPSVRKELLSYLPDSVMVIESIGASEAGLQAMSMDTQSAHAGLPAYDLRDNTVVLKPDRDGIIEPSNLETDVGWIATKGALPLGYLGDEARTLATFPTIGGVRYCVGGDRARFGADGRVLFMGRESQCINSGGEKIYVEEVERIVKSHPAVYDTLVVGVPSERWGQQVTAVVKLAPGAQVPTHADLKAHCSGHLADYKIPRAIVVAEEIVRSPSGKPDYGWAKKFAIDSGT